MSPTPQNVSTDSRPESPGRATCSRQPDDLIYQGFTIAAMLLVLGTLWAF